MHEPSASGSRLKRLVIAADNSLIVDVIALGLRRSGDFKLLGHVDARTASPRTLIDADPDIVLIDDQEQSERTIELIRAIKAARDGIAVLVLTLTMESGWLDAIFTAGATGVISKATHPVALTTLVRETVNGHVIHVYKRLAPGRGAKVNAVALEGSLLTRRELEVLQLVAAGSTNGEIARKLWVTQQTVKFHLANVYRKLEVSNRTEASHYAHVNGLIDTDAPAAVEQPAGAA